MNPKNFLKRANHILIIQGVSVYVLHTNFQKILFFLINFNVTGIFLGGLEPLVIVILLMMRNTARKEYMSQQNLHNKC